jgi:protein TonB
MSLSEAELRAEPLEEASAPEPPSPAERLSAPEEFTPADRRGWALALIAAAALHLIIPLSLIVYYLLWPPAIPTAVQEIPVEVVVEQPPPKPDKPEDKPKPPPEPDDERPAYDAPAAATQEKVNRKSPDKTTQAPASAAAPPPNPGAPLKTDAQSAPPPHELTPTPDGEQQADLNPESDETAAETSAPAAQAPPAEAPVGAPLPSIETLPQYKFARAVKDSPIATGNADSRYFTVIYGMIRSHYREPTGPGATRPVREGAIVFGVDETGNLIGRKVVNSSGSPNLDMALMTAIAEAAPFPAPPNWQPRTMRLTYGR